MTYREKIKLLSSKVPKEIVNFDLKRKRGTAPTQAFSDFLTHNEQGHWAEELFYNSFKNKSKDFIIVHYGKSDNITAGDPEFKAFYEAYQDELDSIGKRPDLLIFNKNDYQERWGEDISKYSLEELANIVPKAIAGLEVRSSAYLSKKFVPKSDRPNLSFTPKVEDLLIVLKWIESYGVPHFYVQVFFDCIYLLPFEDILNLLCNAELVESGIKNKKITGIINDKKVFVIEKNPKNQFKETIHIYLDNGIMLCDKLVEPNLIADRKELKGGRLLHYVKFDGGDADLHMNLLANEFEV